MSAPGHVASLRWSSPPSRSPSPPPPPAAPSGPHALPPPPPCPTVTLLSPPAPHHPKALLLQPDTDLNQPPPPVRTHLPPPTAQPARAFPLADLPDLFGAARAHFASSSLAAIGGEAPVHFIAPAEEMKALFTLPFTDDRVAFPVHRVGDALVLDGARSLGAEQGFSGSCRREASAAASAAHVRSEQALVDALGRIGLLSTMERNNSTDNAARALALPSPPPAFSLTTLERSPVASPPPPLGLHGAARAVGSTQLASTTAAHPAGSDEPPSLYTSFLHHSVSEAAANGRVARLPPGLQTSALAPVESSSLRDGAAAAQAVAREGPSRTCANVVANGAKAIDPASRTVSAGSAPPSPLSTTAKWTFWQPQGSQCAGGTDRDTRLAEAGKQEEQTIRGRSEGLAELNDTRWTFWTQPERAPGTDGARGSDGDAAAEASDVCGAVLETAFSPHATRANTGGADAVDDGRVSAGTADGHVETRWTYWEPQKGEPSQFAAAPTSTAPSNKTRGQLHGRRAGAVTSSLQRASPVQRATFHRHGVEPGAGSMAAESAATGGTGARTSHPFRQVVHWQLKGLGMLLGTSQLVFSSDEHPALSLRLCDMSMPLSPMKVLDFWLDNLMAGIPTLAVCGHVGGVVRGYQVVQTEQLPDWPGARFDANAVLDNAHALLTFLHAHCTRPGGSYWVLKEANADFLRVFDLRALCDAYTASTNAAHNPFGHAVALMCWRMAQRPPGSSTGSTDTRGLLLQCTELLAVSDHPLLWSVAQAQLAQLAQAAVRTREDVDTGEVGDMARGGCGAAPLTRPASSGGLNDGRGGVNAPDMPLGLIALIDAMHGVLPRTAWGTAATLFHLAEALRGAALATVQPPPRVSQLLEEVPELAMVSEERNLARHREQLALALADTVLELVHKIGPDAAAAIGAEGGSKGATDARGPPLRERASSPEAILKCAATKLHLLRAAARSLIGCTGIGPPSSVAPAGVLEVPRCSAPPSPLILPGERRGRPQLLPSPPASPGGRRISRDQVGSGGSTATHSRPRCNADSAAMLARLAMHAGDLLMGLATSEAAKDVAGGLGSDHDAQCAAAEVRDLLLDALSASGISPLPSPYGILPGTDAPSLERVTNLESAAGCYWWALKVSDLLGAEPAALVRRLGGALNESGRGALVTGKLDEAEAKFNDAFTAFSHAEDAVNAALVLVNHATVCRSRARSLQRWRATQAASTRAALAALAAIGRPSLTAADDAAPAETPVELEGDSSQAQQLQVVATDAADIEQSNHAQPSCTHEEARLGPTGGDLELPEVPEVPHRDEVEQLAEAARQQRRAVEAIRPLRASQFGFWVASMRQLAEDETELGQTVLAVLEHESGAERGLESMVKRSAEALARAQAVYEELGEAARSQETMRWQGYLHLVAARREHAAGASRERAAAAHLTIALRQYDRALSPPAGIDVGACSSPPPLTESMEACSAACRLDLASFFLSWRGPMPAEATRETPTTARTPKGAKAISSSRHAQPGGGAVGARLRHVEVALSHAKAGLVSARRLISNAPDAADSAPRDARGEDGGSTAEAPNRLAAMLSQLAGQATRELIRSCEAAGHDARAAELRNQYRQLLADNTRLGG